MPSAVNLTLGKGVHLPSAWVKALGKHYFRNGVGTALDHMAGTCYLCRVLQTRHSAKANFTVCLRSSTWQKANLPSVKMLPSVFWITLGILPVCRVLDFWHSAKRSALGNNRVSGSDPYDARRWGRWWTRPKDLGAGKDAKRAVHGGTAGLSRAAIRAWTTWRVEDPVLCDPFRAYNQWVDVENR